jgi:glutathionyl-hydroquinone reductase
MGAAVGVAITGQGHMAVGEARIVSYGVCGGQTLVRFDEVYIVYFKCNVKPVRDYPAIMSYCRSMYQVSWSMYGWGRHAGVKRLVGQVPEVARAVNMDHIKRHYFSSHPHLNAYAIIPGKSDVTVYKGGAVAQRLTGGG